MLHQIQRQRLRIYFPLLGSIPFKPEIPLPLKVFIIIVSALSFLLCAIAILFDFVSTLDRLGFNNEQGLQTAINNYVYVSELLKQKGALITEEP